MSDPWFSKPMWVVMAQPEPTVSSLYESKDQMVHSIHESHVEAERDMQARKRSVFVSLGTDPSPSAHWVSRMLAYRDSLCIVRCFLTPDRAD